MIVDIKRGKQYDVLSYPTLNEKGGLYNIVENAMGSIAKFRKSPGVELL